MTAAKVCTDPDCPHGDTPQPLGNFYARSDQPGRWQSWCKDSIRKRLAGSEQQEARRARARAWAKADKVTRERHSRTWKAAYRAALKAEGLAP